MAKKNMTLGQYIASQRAKIKISQEALGFRVFAERQKTQHSVSRPLSATAIQKWEKDINQPNFHNLMALSVIFDVSPITIRNIAEGVEDRTETVEWTRIKTWLEVLNKEDLALVEAIIEKIVVAGNKQYQEKSNTGKTLGGK